MDLNKVINDTVKEIPPSGIRKFFDLATEMEGVISLGVGEPDLIHHGKLEKQLFIQLNKEKLFILLIEVYLS